MYPTDHRMRPLGSNHRPTPRLNKLVGKAHGTSEERGASYVDYYAQTGAYAAGVDLAGIVRNRHKYK